MVFFHGGGWVFFRLDAYDPICSHLCHAAGCIVVSVDYRLSPENKFPAATDDCFDSVVWVINHCHELKGDSSRIFLAGDSAGGNLAAVTAIRIRDEFAKTARWPSLRLAGQILIYPVTNYYKPGTPSYVEFADGFSLTTSAMKWFWEKYLESESDADNPHVAPLLAPDLSGLPPALVIVSGCDPLRDEGIAFAKRLEEAGVGVKLSVYEDMIHGFISYLGILKQGKMAIEEIAGWIKKTSSETAKSAE
jgi:acetyl esterase